MLDKIDVALNGVEIYHKRIPDDITQLLIDATEEDLQYIANVKSESRRAEILTTRALIRNSLGDNVSLSHSEDGSPILVGSNLNVSISHCKGMAVIATHPNKRIGIDIERWRNTLLKVKSKFLSQEEMEYYASPDDILKAWTCKEAVYKAANCQGADFAKDIKLPLSNIDNIATVNFCNTTLYFNLITISSNELTLTIAIPH